MDSHTILTLVCIISTCTSNVLNENSVEKSDALRIIIKNGPTQSFSVRSSTGNSPVVHLYNSGTDPSTIVLTNSNGPNMVVEYIASGGGASVLSSVNPQTNEVLSDGVGTTIVIIQGSVNRGSSPRNNPETRKVYQQNTVFHRPDISVSQGPTHGLQPQLSHPNIPNGYGTQQHIPGQQVNYGQQYPVLNLGPPPHFQADGKYIQDQSQVNYNQGLVPQYSNNQGTSSQFPAITGHTPVYGQVPQAQSNYSPQVPTIHGQVPRIYNNQGEVPQIPSSLVPTSQTSPNLGQPSVIPSNHGQPSVIPSNQGQPSVIPSNHGQPSVIPSNHGQPSVIPSNHGQPSVIPSNQGQPSVIPSNQGQPSIIPSNHGQPSVLPSNHGLVSQNPSNHGQVPPNPYNHGLASEVPSSHILVPQNPYNHVQVPQNPYNHGQAPQNTPNHGHVPQNPSNQGQVPQNPSNNGQVPQNPSSHGQVPQNPSNHGQAPPNPSNNGQAPQNPFNHGQVPQNPSNHGQAPQNPFNHGQVPQNTFNHGQVPPNPSNQGLVPEKPFNRGQLPETPIHVKPQENHSNHKPVAQPPSSHGKNTPNLRDAQPSRSPPTTQKPQARPNTSTQRPTYTPKSRETIPTPDPSDNEPVKPNRRPLNRDITPPKPRATTTTASPRTHSRPLDEREVEEAIPESGRRIPWAEERGVSERVHVRPDKTKMVIITRNEDGLTSQPGGPLLQSYIARGRNETRPRPIEEKNQIKCLLGTFLCPVDLATRTSDKVAKPRPTSRSDAKSSRNNEDLKRRIREYLFSKPTTRL